MSVYCSGNSEYFSGDSEMSWLFDDVMVICCIVSPFWYIVPRKIWQPCFVNNRWTDRQLLFLIELTLFVTNLGQVQLVSQVPPHLHSFEPSTVEFLSTPGDLFNIRVQCQGHYFLAKI
jgi:hypothetical protein